MTDLTSGDFLYQSDQELFLVVTDESEDSYSFAVHGWRTISKDRIDEYIDDSRSKVHRQDDVEQLISDEGSENTEKQFNKLKQLFNVYEATDLPNDWTSENFVLEEK